MAGYRTIALAGWICASVAAAGFVPGIARAQRVLQEDRRVVADRLDPRRNPGRRNQSFLDAVGAVWPDAVRKAGAGYPSSTGERASTGFLIDRCHVLTNLHVVDDEAGEAGPPMGRTVAFGVGQTGSELDRGALQGLKTLAAGRVTAQGDARVLDGRVHHPEEDWALIRLDDSIDDIVPMEIAAAGRDELPIQRELWAAGYPSDHRRRRGEGFKLKDLWVSQGEVVDIFEDRGGSLLESTLQTTAGNSGGPVYVERSDGRPVVIGIVQSTWGNGIDRPNVQLLFTPALLARISAARVQSPCAGEPPAGAPKLPPMTF